MLARVSLFREEPLPVVDTVLLDIGGVLTGDPWQELILSPGLGLADRLAIDRDKADAAGKTLWDSYSLSATREADYWLDFSLLVGTDIPESLIVQVESETLHASGSAKRTLAYLNECHVAWGFITDNTSFWFPKQLELLGLKDRSSDNDFTSFQRGVAKSTTGQGLYEVAALELDPRQTLVVDDRMHNIERAAGAGFFTLFYRMSGNADLSEDLMQFMRR